MEVGIILGWRSGLSWDGGRDYLGCELKIMAENPLDFMYFLRFDLASILCVGPSGGKRMNPLKPTNL